MNKIIILMAIIFNTSAFAAEATNLFTASEEAYIASHVFTLGTISDNYPFSYEDKGKLSGFSYDYINLIKKKSGLKIKIEVASWTNTLGKFKAKKIDLIDLISYKESREIFTNFTKPYFEIPSVVFGRKSEFDNYLGFESLKGKKVGITKDLYYYDDIKSLNIFDIVIFENSKDKLKALAYGQVDAVFNNLITGQRLIKSFGFSNIKILAELDSHLVKKEDLRLGVKKEDKMLFSIIEKSINLISREEYELLIDKWFAAKETITLADTSLVLTEEETNFLKNKQVITMCVSPDWLPFERIDKEGIYKGVGADITKIISEKINTPFILVPTKKWSESLQNIRNRKCDILPVAMDVPSRRNSMNFTAPFISEPFVIATRSDELFVKDIASIGNRKIGIVESYAFTEVLKNNNPLLNIIDVESAKEGLAKVQSGELFGYIDIMPAVGYNIQKYSFVDLKIAGRLEHNVDLSIASRNDEHLLNSIMQKSLNSIGENKLRTIVGEWIKIKVEQSINYEKLLYISAAFAVVFLLLLHRSRAIKKTNGQLALLNKEIKEKNIALEQLARTDKLTALYNRVKLDETLIYESNRANRFSHDFGVILIDIDYFKQVNDEFGHQVGDTILQEFSHIIESNSRKTDIVGRWGGEEFLIISPETNLAGLLSLANKLRNEICSYKFINNEYKTASFGISIYKQNEHINKLIKRADEALYKAKKNGRNRVEIG